MIDYLPVVPIVLLLCAAALLWVLRGRLSGRLLTLIATGLLAATWLSTTALLWPLRLGAIEFTLYSWSPVPTAVIPITLHVDALSHLLGMLLVTIFLVATVGTLRDESPACSPWQHLLMAMTLGLVFAGNLAIVVMTWAVAGLIVCFSARECARDEADISRTFDFLIIDQLTGYSLLAGALLAGTSAGGLLTVPIDASATVSGISLVLLILPAVVRLAQYPFIGASRAFHPTHLSVTSVLNASALAISGVYLLLRLSPLASANAGWVFHAALIILGLLSVGYSIIVLSQRTTLGDLPLGMLAMDAGLIVIAVGIGTGEALVAGLFLLISHLFSLLAVATSAGDDVAHVRSGRFITNLVLGLGTLSLAGIPPSLGFWGRWLLAAAALRQFNVLVFLAILISCAVGAWQSMRSVDAEIAPPAESPSSQPARPTRLSFAPALIVILGMALPSPLLGYLVSPALNAAGLGAPLGLASGLADWAGLIAVLALIVCGWLCLQFDPMPNVLSRRLGLTLRSEHSFTAVVGLDFFSVAGRWIAHRIAGDPLWFRPERITDAISHKGLKLGEALESTGEAIEQRYFAPALVVAVILVLFVFLT